MAEKVYLNDKLIDADKAAITASDSGFLYGAGLFETMRAHKGVVFALDDHLDRLAFSARSLAIDAPYDKDYICRAVYETLAANGLEEARLRLTLTSGSMAVAQESRQATLLITATRFLAYPPEFYTNGVTVILCPYRQNPYEPTTGHKVTSYFGRMTALRLAHERRAAEALWFTIDNRLAEGCISNVFLVKDSTLVTPPINTPVLAGIARKALCHIAAKESVKLVEKDLTIDDLLAADEVLLTNVIMQILPVIAVEKHSVGDGNVGPLTKKLIECFNGYVETCCAGKK